MKTSEFRLLLAHSFTKQVLSEHLFQQFSLLMTMQHRGDEKEKLNYAHGCRRFSVMLSRWQFKSTKKRSVEDIQQPGIWIFLARLSKT